MTHNTREWEKEFDEQFKGAIQLKNKPDGVTVTRLKHFIHQELQKAGEEERERIEAIFKEHVPPHAIDLEDSVWLKRLLNKAFQHENLY